MENLAFHFWVVLEDARLFSSPLIMLFTEGWDFPVILLKCLSKFLFCSVFDKQNAVLINYLLHPQNKLNVKDCLTQLLSHAVTCCIMCQLTIVASCSTDTWVQIFVRYCIILHVRKVYQKLNNTSGRDISSNFLQEKLLRLECWCAS